MPGDIQLLGDQRELFPKHQFVVEIGGGDISAAFQKCSELSSEAAKIEYWEGGSSIPWKVPGRLAMTDVTLERGASSSRKFYDWMISVMDASAGAEGTEGLSRGVGALTPRYMRQIEIIQLDRDAATPLRIWKLHNAWPTKFVAGDWDNTADDVVIEALTLTFDLYTLEQ
jgi:phage tail-like protein